MTNYEKYKDKIIDFLVGSECRLVARMKGIEDRDCWSVGCEECEKELKNWLNAEYTEEIDWSKVEQGTIVYDITGKEQGKFIAKYENGIVLDVDYIDEDCAVDLLNIEVCRLEK